jgi:hypothetical protein
MMSVEHHTVKAQLFGIDTLVQIFVHEPAADFGVKVSVRDAKVAAAIFDDQILWHLGIRTFRERHNMHRDPSLRVVRLKIVVNVARIPLVSQLLADAALSKATISAPVSTFTPQQR